MLTLTEAREFERRLSMIIGDWDTEPPEGMDPQIVSSLRVTASTIVQDASDNESRTHRIEHALITKPDHVDPSRLGRRASRNLEDIEEIDHVREAEIKDLREALNEVSDDQITWRRAEAFYDQGARWISDRDVKGDDVEPQEGDAADDCEEIGTPIAPRLFARTCGHGAVICVPCDFIPSSWTVQP